MRKVSTNIRKVFHMTIIGVWDTPGHRLVPSYVELGAYKSRVYCVGMQRRILKGEAPNQGTVTRETTLAKPSS